MNQTERRPDWMIATKHETVSRSAKDSLHSSAVSFNSRCAWIIEPTAMNRAPEVCVKFEVTASPFCAHHAEKMFEMLLHLWMCSVQHIPWATAPTAERYQIRAQRLTVSIFYEPFLVLLKNVRLLLGNKRRNPYSWFKSALTYLP